MAKLKIKNLKKLEETLINTVGNNIYKNSHLQQSSAEIMQEVVEENVYDEFTPEEYDRRGRKDGFADMGGMVFTDIVSNGKGSLKINFENTNEGIDGLTGEEMTEMFEKGQKDKWENPNVQDDEGRINSNRRPFIQYTIDTMNVNKDELLNALAKDLSEYGFKVRIGKK